MKLVVEISEDIYKTLKTVTNIVYGFRSGKTLVHACLTAIRNGIPLDEHEKAYRDLLNAISKEITSLPSELDDMIKHVADVTGIDVRSAEYDQS